MPEHYIGEIDFQDERGGVLRRIICGCGHECQWSDIWEPAIESYADHRTEMAIKNATNAHDLQP